MRKIVAGLFMSLDGVVEAPENWGYQYFNEELTKSINEGISQSDAVLVGRRTYLEFAEIWPGQSSEIPMSTFLNGARKYVVSKTLKDLEWGPASLIAGDLAEELMRLKLQPGKNIQIPGFPTLVRSLLVEGLLDELSLGICPTVVGAGLHMFDDVTDRLDLKVIASTIFSNGVINVTYGPAMADQVPATLSAETFPAREEETPRV